VAVTVIGLPRDLVRVRERSFRLAPSMLSSQGLFGGLPPRADA
jgi:hypothetical protein